MPLSDSDKCLTRLFMSGCFHHWELIPELGQKCYAAGCTLEEVLATKRPIRGNLLCRVAGYGPCLAATNHLHAAKLLDGNTPGKVGGPPGDAFELVYTVVTDAVREKMHNVDPVLTEYIRRHLYGDIYSSPGLSLAQKQVLMIAFLGEANMHEQLFGHLLAAMRFGNDLEACLKAIQIGFELSPRPSDTVYQGAVKTLEMAYRKYKKDFKEGPPQVPTVTNPDPGTVLIPPLHKPVDRLQREVAAESLQEDPEERDAIVAMASPTTEKQPMLQRAGPSEAFSKLQIERSGPSGNFSKLYNLKVRAFAHDMSRSTADSATP